MVKWYNACKTELAMLLSGVAISTIGTALTLELALQGDASAISTATVAGYGIPLIYAPQDKLKQELKYYNGTKTN